MLIKKDIASRNGKIINTSQYTCDMCEKPLRKMQRIRVMATEIGGEVALKKWDLCEKCMKIIEKNVKIWYGKIVNKK